MRWGHVFRLGTCLHVTGEDALSFLQGQFTQELKSSFKAPVAYGLWLNQKGKVLADSFVLKEADDDIWVISFSAHAEVIRKRLENYIIADDVVIDDQTSQWGGLVVGGIDAAVWLVEQTAGRLPESDRFIRTADGFLFRGRRGAGESWEWILPNATAFPGGLATVSAEVIERLRITAGIPAVPIDIGAGDLPNEGGLEVDAISYTKGCYLGQEMMARLKSMGQLRRRLVRVRAMAAPPPSVPCALLQGETRVGELRSAVADGAGGFIGLALVMVLRLDPSVTLATKPGGPGVIHIIDTL